MKRTLTIRDLMASYGEEYDLRLTVLAGENGLDRTIDVPDVNRPGLSLTGFFEYFAFDRIQIFGRGETAYLHKLEEDRRCAILEQFFSYDVLCCIFSHGDHPSDMFIEHARKKNVPLLVSGHHTTRLISLITHIIEEAHAPTVSVHGTLVDVFGLGVLLMGKSGVGKSETALELIERGHRLVADDIVEVRRIGDSMLVGSGSPIIRHHIEIRGLGILNIKDVYGIRSVRDRKRLDLVVSLEDWDSGKSYDRLGIDEGVYSILDIELPHLLLPVRPGRNIPIIVETGALNQRLKKMGVFSAREFDQKLQEWMKMESQKRNV